MSTTIVQCTCNNEYQDKRYGTKMRVANKTAKGKTNDVYRCTSCEREHEVKE